MSEEAPHLLVDRDGPVLTVTLNRPEAKNAFSGPMLVAAYDAWKELDSDPELRVGILTGAGGDFCSGMDLKALAAGMSEQEQARFADDPDLHWKALLRHFRPGKPLVAAVEGYCVAGGTEILQATELRVAGESAQFGIAEVRRGLFPLENLSEIEGLANELELGWPVFATEDAKEGATAFAEKRPPHFTGR